MSSAINNISLYIPHIFANYSKENVSKVFEDLGIGKVKNIDFVSKMSRDNKPFNAAYIHFDYWCNNSIAANFQERVLNPEKEARLIYDEPWHWIVLENKARKFKPGDRKLRIDIGELTCLGAHVKSQRSYRDTVNIVPENLNDAFISDGPIAFDDDNAAMAECQVLMEEEEKHTIQIDGRYVQTMEEENNALRMQLAHMQNAFYIEQVKSQTLAEAFGKIHKD
jgi:hypothetical protein